MESGSIEHQLGEDEQLCFIHIPKTAGTTFTSILDAKFNQADICPAAVWSELVQLSPAELATYKLLRGHFYYYVHKFLPQKPVYITMLRDPIERVISGYEFMRRHRPSRPEGLPTHEKALTMSLKEYVCDPTVPGITNAQTRHISLNLYKELSEDLTHPKWLESAKQNLEEFAFVGVTEQFDNSMSLLAYIFGWNPLVEYQNLMVAPKRLRQEALSTDVIDAIAERNQLDIALYQVAKAKFEAQHTQMLQTLSEQFGYSDAEQLQPKQIQGLLEKQYEHRCAELNRSPVERLTFDFNQALFGSGWHLREGLERHHVFRWTGPGTVSILDLPRLEPQDAVIQFRIINTVSSDILESLTLQVNGHVTPFVPLHSDEITTVFQGYIPSSCLISDLPFTRLTFSVSRTTSLHSVDPNNLDTRPVGLAFDLIQLYAAGSAASSCAVSFLFDSPAWQETIEFLQHRLEANDIILAPTIFSLKFSDHMPSQPVEGIKKTQNYNPNVLQSSAFEWAILHKGMAREMGAILPKLALSGFKPVLANEVFVVFSKHTNLPALSYAAPHVKSLYGGYGKYYLAQQTQGFERLLGRLKLFAKQTIKPIYVDDIRPFYAKHLKKRFK